MGFFARPHYTSEATDFIESLKAANATLEAAMADAAERDAKDEATRRAFSASGQTVEAFADMYGLQVRAVADALARAGRWAA